MNTVCYRDKNHADLLVFIRYLEILFILVWGRSHISSALSTRTYTLEKKTLIEGLLAKNALETLRTFEK